MVWIKTVFGWRDVPSSRMHLGKIFAAGAAVIANLPIPAFAADLAAGTGPAPSVSLPAFTWISANALGLLRPIPVTKRLAFLQRAST
jgi:hypothetical protein